MCKSHKYLRIAYSAKAREKYQEKLNVINVHHIYAGAKSTQILENIISGSQLTSESLITWHMLAKASSTKRSLALFRELISLQQCCDKFRFENFQKNNDCNKSVLTETDSTLLGTKPFHNFRTPPIMLIFGNIRSVCDAGCRFSEARTLIGIVCKRNYLLQKLFYFSAFMFYEKLTYS